MFQNACRELAKKNLVYFSDKASHYRADASAAAAVTVSSRHAGWLLARQIFGFAFFGTHTPKFIDSIFIHYKHVWRGKTDTSLPPLSHLEPGDDLIYVLYVVTKGEMSLNVSPLLGHSSFESSRIQLLQTKL